MSRGDWAHRARPWVVAVFVLVVGLCVRVVMGGYGALEKAEAAVEAGQPLRAQLEYRRAMAWYLPVAPWREGAAQALWRLAESDRTAGRWEAAVGGLNMLRAGLLAPRGLGGWTEDWLSRCDEALVEALVRWEAEVAATQGRPVPDKASRAGWFRQRLAHTPMPSRTAGAMASIGFVVWLLGAAWFAKPQSTDTGAGRGPYTALALSGLGLLGFLGGLALAG